MPVGIRWCVARSANAADGTLDHLVVLNQANNLMDPRRTAPRENEREFLVGGEVFEAHRRTRAKCVARVDRSLRRGGAARDPLGRDKALEPARAMIDECLETAEVDLAALGIA